MSMQKYLKSLEAILRTLETELDRLDDLAAEKINEETDRLSIACAELDRVISQIRTVYLECEHDKFRRSASREL